MMHRRQPCDKTYNSAWIDAPSSPGMQTRGRSCLQTLKLSASSKTYGDDAAELVTTLQEERRSEARSEVDEHTTNGLLKERGRFLAVFTCARLPGDHLS